MRGPAARQGMCSRRALQRFGDGRRTDARLTSGSHREDRHVQALLRPRHLRAGFPHRFGRGRRLLHGRAARLQEQPADHPAISCDQSEGAGAGAGDGPRHLDRNTGNSRFHCESFPKAKLVPDDPFAFAQAQSFNSYLCSTVHINHAHKMRGYRWAVEESSFADMKRKVPETMAGCFALIERDMIKGPWVMGEQYTVCDPYLYTIALWLEGDGVDLAPCRRWPLTASGCRSGPRCRRCWPRRRLKIAGWAPRSGVSRRLHRRGLMVGRRFAPCPPYILRSLLPPLHLAADAEHDVAQPDRARVHLGAGRVEHELLVDPGIERWRDRCQR